MIAEIHKSMQPGQIAGNGIRLQAVATGFNYRKAFGAGNWTQRVGHVATVLLVVL